MAANIKAQEIKHASVSKHSPKPSIEASHKLYPQVHPATALQRVKAAHPRAISPHDILTLQGTIGNRAVQRLLSERARQASETSDVRAPIQSQHITDPVVDVGASQVQRGNNTGLPDKLKDGIENLSGLSMDDVKTHYNSSEPAQVQALAYTQGTEIHVGAGQEKYLPHEAWHIVQQKQGRVLPTMQAKGASINDDSSLEHEADVMGTKALQMSRPDQVAIGSDVSIADKIITVNARQMRGTIQRHIGFEYETSMALQPPKPKDAVIARGDNYDVRVDNADGQAVVEIVVDHQPETEEGRNKAEAALKAVRSDLEFANVALAFANVDDKVLLTEAGGGIWNNIDESVKLLPSAEHKQFTSGALQATAGLTLAALGQVLKEDPTMKQGLEQTWGQALTPEISGKLFKGNNATIGSAAEAHVDLWAKTKAGIEAYALKVIQDHVGVEALSDGQMDELISVAVSLVRVPVIAQSMVGAPDYYKLLAGNLLHKTDLGTLWSTLLPIVRTFIGRDKGGFISKLYSIITNISGKDINGDSNIIPATLAREGDQSRSPVLALKLKPWYEGIINNGVDKLTSVHYDVESEWNTHQFAESHFGNLLGAPPKGWKQGGKLDSLENMKKRVKEGLEGFGDLNATDPPLSVDAPRRPIFEFRSIGKGTTLENLPNTALAVWDYINLALGKAAYGPEKVEQQVPEQEIASNDDDLAMRLQNLKK